MPRRRKKKTGWSARLAWLAVRLAGILTLGTALFVVPFRWIDPPTSAFILREATLGQAPVRHPWRDLDRISPELALAVIAAEDQKFPSHSGFDLKAIHSALTESRSQIRGASTISQQVAKNLYLWPGRSLFRKGLEAWFTGWIEATWPKRRILEVYLNLAEFAPGVFGAEAASVRIYGKTARTLTAREASLLAAVLPNPKQMNAGRPSPYVEDRAASIRQAGRRLGGTPFLRDL